MPKSIKGVIRFLGYIWFACLLIIYATIIILIFLCPAWISASIILTSILLFFIFLVLAYSQQKHRKKFKKVAGNLLIPAMVLWGGKVILFFICMICSLGLVWPMTSSKVEFPLEALKGIAVDNHGQIYCGVHHYSRLQVYDEKGRFVRGWFCPISYKGTYNIETDEDDRVRIALFSQGVYTEYLYDPNSLLISEKDIESSEYDKEFGVFGDFTARDDMGNEYILKNPVIYPRVIKIDTYGNKSVLISNSFDQWITIYPFPGFVCFAISLITHACCTIDPKER
jgi:hypothetical protein